MGKIVISQGKEIFKRPSVKLDFYEPNDTHHTEAETIYCSPEEVDGHWLIKIGCLANATAIRGPNLVKDRIIGVTSVSHKDRIPDKLLECARKYAQTRLTPDSPLAYTSLEDLTLKEIKT